MINAQVIPVIQNGRVSEYLVNPLPCWPRHNLKEPRASWTPADSDLARSMWLRGKSFGQIARELSRSRSAVASKIIRMGLTGMKGSAS